MKIVTRGKADLAIFHKVSERNQQRFLDALESGIPMVVAKGEDGGLIHHTEDGFVYDGDQYARHWVQLLTFNPGLREKFGKAHMRVLGS